MFCHMAYHMAYQIILYMDPIFKPWIVSNFLTLISGLKSSMRGNNGFIMWYKYYSCTIALRLSSFSFPTIHRGYLSVCSQGPFLWIRLLIKGAHTWVFTCLPHRPSCKFLSPFSPLWLCYWSTDPYCLAPSICHFAPNCPLTSPSRTNRWNKIRCPAITKREKWESVKMFPCRDAAIHKKRKRNGETKDLTIANEVKKRGCLVPKVNRHIFNHWLAKNRETFWSSCRKKKYSIMSLKELTSGFFLTLLSH